jgi:hypothetical protein
VKVDVVLMSIRAASRKLHARIEISRKIFVAGASFRGQTHRHPDLAALKLRQGLSFAHVIPGTLYTMASHFYADQAHAQPYQQEVNLPDA